MHYKQMRLKSMSILSNIKQKLGANWESFLEKLKQEAMLQMETKDNMDGISVDFSFFLSQLQNSYHI